MFDFGSVKEVRLSVGAHKAPEQGMCFMEMAAWFAGEEHSDQPKCVSPVLGRLGIMLNDQMGDRQRDETLKPMIPHVVGTFDNAAELDREHYIAVRAFNYAAPLIANDYLCRERPARDIYDVVGMAHGIFHNGRLGDALRGRSRALRDLAHAFQIFVDRRFGDAPDIFKLAGEIIPDWSAAIDTLREAIKLGRHDGFDVSVNLAARHAELVKLPKVAPMGRAPAFV
jgi:hypothetical protein